MDFVSIAARNSFGLGSIFRVVMGNFTFSRHPAILLAAVSLAIGLAWYGLGLPKTMPRSPLGADGKVPCVSYAPFRGDQSPLDPALTVPPEQIDADLKRLSQVTSCIRTYATEKRI